MNKYKYFFKSDTSKESIGNFIAKDLNEAFIKASYIKKLAPMHFKELFDVKQIDE